MTRRSERLGDEVRQELAGIIDRQLKDPRVGFVTVTRVRLTADLRSARVYVGVLGDEPARERSLAGLQSAVGFLRRQLGRRLRLRHTPELAFFYDEGLDATERVAQLLTENVPESPPEDEPEGE
jgi:ribosome-binding factor A